MTFEQWLAKERTVFQGELGHSNYDLEDLQTAFEAGYEEGKDAGWVEGQRDADDRRQWID